MCCKMFFNIIRSLLFFQLIHIIDCYQVNKDNDVYVSNSKISRNYPACGVNATVPCETIAYAVSTALKDKTEKKIILDVGDPSKPYTYTYKVNSTITTAYNVSFKPSDKNSKVKPIIKMQSGLFFINEPSTVSSYLHKLSFNSIHFIGVSIVNFTGVNLRLDVSNCFVEKSPKHAIYSEVKIQKADIYINKKSKFRNCNGIFNAERSTNLNIQVSDNCEFMADEISPAYSGFSITNATDTLHIKVTGANFHNLYKPITVSTDVCGNKTVNMKVSLQKSSFRNNLKQIEMSGCLTCNVQDSKFNGNVDGVLAFTDSKIVLVQNVIFSKNTGRSALTLIRTAKSIIMTSSFTENTDKFQGGAIFGYDNTINIQKSNFSSNYAPLSGGTIYHDASATTGTEIDLNHVTISSKFGEHTRQGTLIYSSQKVKLQDTRLILQPGPLSNLDSYVDAMTSNVGVLVVPQASFQMSCPPGNNLKIVHVGNTTRPGITSKIGVYSLGCEKCPTQTFSLDSAKINSANFDHNKVKCISCPEGGNCSNRIISQDNFWGYQSINKEFKFLQCPKGYCCSKETSPCTSYQACDQNRNGVLCGTCKAPHTLNFFSDKCSDNSDCNSIAFWIINILYALVIGCCFLNLEYILLSLSGIVNRKKPMVISEIPNDDEGLVNQAADDTIDLCDSPTRTTSKEGNSNLFAGSDAADFIIGFGKIIAFFYQIEVLLRVNTNKNYGVLSIIEDFILSFFNYRFDTNGFLSFCPSRNMNHVNKEVIKFTTVLISPVLMVLLYLPIAVKRYIQKDGTCDLHLRIRQCLLHLTLFSYTNIANFCIIMINCVDILGRKHLFINGDTVCYSAWQYFIFAFIVLWLIPFPISMYFAVRLLRSHSITPRQFYSIVIFPWCIVMYYVATHRTDSSSGGRVDSNIKMEVDCILQVFTGPYKEGKNGAINGEADILLQRLVLSVVCCALNDPATRLFISFPILLMFLMYHIYVYPFKRPFNNGLQTICLLFLLWFNATHLLWAFSYTNGWTNNTVVKKMVSIFNILQDILIALPALLVLLSIVLMLLKKAGSVVFCRQKKKE